MPLADEVGGVAGLAQLAGQRWQRFIQAEPVMPHAGLRGVPAGEEHRARRCTHRLVGDRMRKVLSARRQRIQVGRSRGVVAAVGADKVPAKLIGKIQNDVGWLRRLERRRLRLRLRDSRYGSSYCRGHRAFEERPAAVWMFRHESSYLWIFAVNGISPCGCDGTISRLIFRTHRNRAAGHFG